MSRDQRPGKIKIVSSGSPSPGAGSAVAVANGAQQAGGGADAASGAAAADTAPATGSFLIPAILFLVGCLVGGAGLVALLRFAG
ncbi:hypothetical protein [Stakelama marina]|uniref:Uncharacterized protein n=1 Tax=Stakelama marina TaxID=2826939 RepID=A0A8T4IF86_9SPHN|nr:hypothetical protein [Stakelama marina]MBR0550919.1 hypothetical protein [Stakelama marina]